MGTNRQVKAEYAALTSYFKYLVAITIGAITMVGSVVAVLTYNGMKDLKSDLRDEVTQRRDLFKDEVQRIEEDLLRRQLAMQLDIDMARSEANRLIEQTKNDAQSEAINRIEEVFDDRNIEQFVNAVADRYMENRISSLVEDRIHHTQKVEVELAIDRLKSKDMAQFQLGLVFFQTNLSQSLSDEQLKNIVDIVEGPMNEQYKSMLIGVTLVYRNSPVCTEYFIRTLEDKFDENYAAMTYFAMFNSDFKNVEGILLRKLNTTDNPVSVYSQIRSYTGLGNDFALSILNSRPLTDAIKRRVSLEEIDRFKEAYRELTSSGLIAESDLTSTYFFKK